MDRYERIIAMHRLLQAARRPVTVRRLMDELGCSRATAYRDLAYLRDGLMAPLVGDGEAGFSYDKDEATRFELPGLWLNSEELHALLAAHQLELSNILPTDRNRAGSRALYRSDQFQ